MAELAALGMVKTERMAQWTIRSQALSGSFSVIHTSAVHRLDGSGRASGSMSLVCLRYSRALCESRVFGEPSSKNFILMG